MGNGGGKLRSTIEMEFTPPKPDEDLPKRAEKKTFHDLPGSNQ
jgi:hypothetical protein